MNPKIKIDLIENEIDTLNIALHGWISHEMCDTRTRIVIDLEDKLEQKKRELRSIKIQFGL